MKTAIQNVRAESPEYDSPGQRPGYGRRYYFPALKGRHKGRLVVCFITIMGAQLLRGICLADTAGNVSQNAPATVGHDVRSAGKGAQVSQSARNLHYSLEAPRIKGGVVKNLPANVLPFGQPLSTPAHLPAKPTPGGVHNPTTRPSVIQPAGPLLTKAPDHGQTQAVIGGSVTPKVKTTATAAVTGTGLNRKP